MSLAKVDFAPVLIGLLISLFVAQLLGPLAGLLAPGLETLTWKSEYLSPNELILLYLEGLYILIGAFVAGKRAGTQAFFAGIMVGLLYVLLYQLIPPLTVGLLAKYMNLPVTVRNIPMSLRIGYLITGAAAGLLGALLSKIRFSVKVAE